MRTGAELIYEERQRQIQMEGFTAAHDIRFPYGGLALAGPAGRTEPMSLEALVIVVAILFVIGLYGRLARSNVIAVLMSLEIMFNAVNLTLVALAKFVAPQGLQDNLSNALTGQVFAVFVITVAAAEIALGLGIVLAMYRNTESVDLAQATQLRN